MTTTTLVSAVTQLYSGSNSTSVSTFSSVLDLRSAMTAYVTMRLATATAPTVQCVCNVLWYHSTSATPPTAASASAGATGWKTLWSFGSGIVASTVTEQKFTPPQGGYLCLEFTASATNTVACEGFATVITSASSV
jgi:hypothetical protein